MAPGRYATIAAECRLHSALLRKQSKCGVRKKIWQRMAGMKITVWNENVHEKELPKLLEIYPGGIHGVLADIVKEVPGAEVTVATLDMPQAGLPAEVLDNTDVLLWWGHAAHDKVPDEVVERVHARVLAGMGLIVLHSGHESKIFRKIMGTSGALRWRDDTYERMFCVNPSHPIAEGIPMHFELGVEECYAEYFDIPQPDELVFTSWYDIGEVFRSGCVWRRGYGKVFYFQPGHETNQSYHHPHVRRIIQNACRWAVPARQRDQVKSQHIETPLEETRKAGQE